mmetsp:Transcript_4237/g.15629  ORF Transcript_4237/g.15629 Transcript_4237/m.15629 type:complete len:263 (-) Transcript_4237:856-1644(-)
MHAVQRPHDHRQQLVHALFVANTRVCTVPHKQSARQHLLHVTALEEVEALAGAPHVLLDVRTRRRVALSQILGVLQLSSFRQQRMRPPPVPVPLPQQRVLLAHAAHGAWPRRRRSPGRDDAGQQEPREHAHVRVLHGAAPQGPDHIARSGPHEVVRELFGRVGEHVRQRRPAHLRRRLGRCVQHTRRVRVGHARGAPQRAAGIRRLTSPVHGRRNSRTRSRVRRRHARPELRELGLAVVRGARRVGTGSAAARAARRRRCMP